MPSLLIIVILTFVGTMLLVKLRVPKYHSRHVLIQNTKAKDDTRVVLYLQLQTMYNRLRNCSLTGMHHFDCCVNLCLNFRHSLSLFINKLSSPYSPPSPSLVLQNAYFLSLSHTHTHTPMGTHTTFLSQTNTNSVLQRLTLLSLSLLSISHPSKHTLGVLSHTITLTFPSNQANHTPQHTSLTMPYLTLTQLTHSLFFFSRFSVRDCISFHSLSHSFKVLDLSQRTASILSC